MINAPSEEPVNFWSKIGWDLGGKCISEIYIDIGFYFLE